MQYRILATVAFASLSQAQPVDDTTASRVQRSEPAVKRVDRPANFRVIARSQSCSAAAPATVATVGPDGVHEFKDLWGAYDLGINQVLNFTQSFSYHDHDRPLLPEERLAVFWYDRPADPPAMSTEQNSGQLQLGDPAKEAKCQGETPDWTKLTKLLGPDDFKPQDTTPGNPYKPSCAEIKGNCIVLIPTSATNDPAFPKNPPISQDSIQPFDIAEWRSRHVGQA